MEEHQKTKHSKKEKELTKNHPPKKGKKYLKTIRDKAVFTFREFTGKNNKEAQLKSVKRIIDNCEKNHFISSEAKKMVNNIFNIGDLKVDDIMIPRADIIAIHQDISLEGIKEFTVSKEHSRMPVYKDNLDEIIGFVHSKDLIKFIGKQDNSGFKIKDIIRKIIFVPGSMKIIDLLLKMRSSRVHIAVVLDEYGGTDGIVTIEDIVEEIVGEIEDEYDVPNQNIYNVIKKVDAHTIHVGGRIEIKKVEELLGVKVFEEDEEPDFDTVGGLMLSAFKKVPESGEAIKYSDQLSFKVLSADVRSVKLAEIKKA
jgi:CBS domain containing-hemolysin-like protein